MLPSDLFHRNVVFSFQEDAIYICLRDLIGVDVGLGLSAQRVDISPIAQDPSRNPGGRAGDEQAKIVGPNTARVYRFDGASLTVPDVPVQWRFSEKHRTFPRLGFGLMMASSAAVMSG
jgi:hypothetical protein